MGKTGLAPPVALPQTCGFMFGKMSKLEQEHLGCFPFQGVFSFPGLAYFKTHLSQSPASAVVGSPRVPHGVPAVQSTPQQRLGTSRARDSHTERVCGFVGF